jgi:hypothetical protein
MNRFVPGKEKDIAILSSPRSGSTWLMELISTQSRVTYRDEPDHRVLIDCHDLVRGMRTRWCYADLTADEWSIIKAYLLDDKRLRLFGPKMPWRDGDWIRANRRVLKFVRMAPLIQLFEEELGMSVVYLIRHPIPQILSSKKQGHIPQLDEFIGSPRFMRTHCTSHQRSIVENIALTGSIREQLIAEWSLVNLLPHRYLPMSAHSMWLTYEEIVAYPAQFQELLATRLGLTDAHAIQDRFRTPSKRSDMSDLRKKHAIFTYDTEEIMNSWRSVVSSRDEEILLEIAAELGVGIYEAGRNFPKSWPSLFSTASPTNLVK